MNCAFCEFKWRILCSYFDTKFGYVKLMLNMLLLLNLHVWILAIWNFVNFCSNGCKIVLLCWLLMNLCLNDVVAVVRCCCCWIVPWVFQFVRLWFELRSCVKFYVLRTKMNFWWMKLLTEILMLLNGLNLVELLFLC